MATKPYGRVHGEAQPCYLTHKPLQLGKGILIGGRCGKPIVDDADIYISFDLASHPIYLTSLPWNEGESFCFPIINGSVPNMLDEFKALVKWSAGHLDSGATIHCGCIGGHGRTGIFLAAVVAEMIADTEALPRVGGLVDATGYVRKNYCHKAVETPEQVDWLGEHFQIKPVEPYYVTRKRASGKR